MIGSSAAALTGLMFVVITLVTRDEDAVRSRDGVSTYSTPTVMHFCAVLLVSAVLVAPWRALVHPAILIALTGLGGIVYVARVIERAKRMAYTPDLEDWVWYHILPLLTYIVLFAGSIALPIASPEGALAIAATVVILIFIGIHNAWDVVTFSRFPTMYESLERGQRLGQVHAPVSDAHVLVARVVNRTRQEQDAGALG